MKGFRIVNLIAFILLAIGGLAWLIIGLFDMNFITAITFDSAIAGRILYSLVGLSTLWLLFSATYTGHIGFPWEKSERR